MCILELCSFVWFCLIIFITSSYLTSSHCRQHPILFPVHFLYCTSSSKVISIASYAYIFNLCKCIVLYIILIFLSKFYVFLTKNKNTMCPNRIFQFFKLERDTIIGKTSVSVQVVINNILESRNRILLASFNFLSLFCL